MHLKLNLSAKQCLLLLLMVAPATAYTNINAALTEDSKGIHISDTQDEGSPWITSDGLSLNVTALANAIADAEAHGLNPNVYHLTSIEQALESFVNNSEKSGSYLDAENAEQQQNLERQLQQSFVRFASDLGTGVLDAQATQKNLKRPAPIVDTKVLLMRLNSGESSVGELLAELTPSAPQYVNLVEHMRTLLKQRDSAVARTTVEYFEDVVKGTHHDSVVKLRLRLHETGDLSPESHPDTYFSTDVKKALMDFQRRIGLTVTGELTEDTVIALNATIDEDIEQVAMNLERWRWMPRELGERHILINIPAYQLTMMNGEQRIVDMAVVVGSKKHQTPVFSEGARYVEVAPTWIVPASITNNEIIPIELNQPGYIDSERMDYFRWEKYKLVHVPRSELTPEDFLEKPFPYVLQQRSGKDNALGRVKILMPNKYAIYMHDTQAQELFAKTDRAFSHGCIRLSDPLRLSSLLLQIDGMSLTDTTAFLSKKKTKRVKLNTETPTHIAYFTAWIGDDGKLHKRKDVYKYNKQLVAGLNAEDTLLAILDSRAVTVLAKKEK